jgi:uncharacterized protein (TIGR03086 family)
VRDLLNHLVGGNHAFAAVLTGQGPPDRGADHLGDDPSGAYRRSGHALQAAFARPGVMDKTVIVPAGAVSGAVALDLRITEILVHGRDLADATGQPTTGLPDDLAETELAFSRRALAQLRPDRHPFAPPQPVSEDAPVVDRLAALLGRPLTRSAQEPADDQIAASGARVRPAGGGTGSAGRPVL